MNNLNVTHSDELVQGEGSPTDATVEAGGINETVEENPSKPVEKRPILSVANLRLPPTFGKQGAFVKEVMRIQVGKPNQNSFFRVSNDPEMFLETYLVRLKERNENYIVSPDLWEQLLMEPTFKPYRIVVGVTRQGTPFLWPLKLPGPDGKLDDWSQAALEIAEISKTHWTRMISNMEAGSYEAFHPANCQIQPVWPNKTLQELVDLGFKGRIITNMDHAVLRELRGE